MSEREEPDLDQVRDAMRDHDERLREEDARDEGAGDEHAGDKPPGDEPPGEPSEDDDDLAGS